MIQPSVGRIVLYRPDGHPADAPPHAAIVAFVHSERFVNLVIFNELGNMYHAQSAPLLQDDDTPPAAGGYAEWMPFQKGQANKAEAAEGTLVKQLADLAIDVDAKFKSLGDWLTPALDALGKRIDAITPPAGS